MCAYFCVYVCVYVCLYVCVWLHVCVHVCVCIDTCSISGRCFSLACRAVPVDFRNKVYVMSTTYKVNEDYYSDSISLICPCVKNTPFKIQ